MDKKYEADHQLMFLAADGSMMCETHPGREWPHGDCPGPGMPWVISGRTLIEETLYANRHDEGQNDTRHQMVKGTCTRCGESLFGVETDSACSGTQRTGDEVV